MKKILLLISMFAIGLAQSASARKQWTVKQAQAWEKRVGELKGFNEPYPNPGQNMDSLFRRAHELGLNSVRMWIGGNEEQAITRLQGLVDLAYKYDMYLSPVLSAPVRDYTLSDGKDEQAAKKLKDFCQHLIGHFAKEKRVVMWDLYNEPGCVNFGLDGNSDEVFIAQLKTTRQLLYWAREVNPSQALSSSIFWRIDLEENKTPLHQLARQVESEMDVHNFHSYGCQAQQGKEVRHLMDYLREISPRPLVCTECLTRDNNSALARTFAAFQPYDVHFYVWGLYLCDRNWTIRWGHSAYDAYDPGFHNLMRPDGEMIDWRDVELIRNYHFTHGQEVDKGAEYTDKWDSQRAWRWMSTGPIKGCSVANIEEAMQWLSGSESNDYNSLSVPFSFTTYQSDKQQFYKTVDELLQAAADKQITVLPILLSDVDMTAKDDELQQYEEEVVHHYAFDARIQAWDLYWHPGENNTDTKRITDLLRMLFRNARYDFPNQPVFSTPFVEVKPFDEGFNYHDAFIHGRTAGWGMFKYKGGATAELCALVWQLSDVISFSSRQSAGQTGWLKAVAYRYSRPIFCMDWAPADDAAARETLENFSQSHVFWYTKKGTALPDIQQFRFKLISTRPW